MIGRWIRKLKGYPTLNQVEDELMETGRRISAGKKGTIKTHQIKETMEGKYKVYVSCEDGVCITHAERMKR